MCTKETNHNHTNFLILSFREYLQVLKYSNSSQKSYVESLKTFLDFLSSQGINDLRAVTKDTIRDYLKHLLEQKGKYTLETVSIKYRATKRLFEYLEKTNQVLINPTTGISGPSLGKRLPKNILTKEEVKKMLNAPNTSTLTGIRNKTILEVFYSTGIRLEELHNLTVFDIDLQSGYLRVNKGKFAKDRVVPLGKVAVQYLKEYIEKVRPIFTKNRRDERALFVVKTGGKVSKKVVSLMIRDCARVAGINKQVSSHSFRHTFATHLISDNANILHVQKLLGHSTPAVTQIYTRVTPKEVKATLEKTHPRERDKE